MSYANSADQNTYARKWRAAHPAQVKANRRKWRLAHPEKHRVLRRAYDLRRYKLRPEQRRTYTRRYNGLPEPTRPCPETCEGCGRLPGRRGLHLDHDHETGAFRGWLCGKCNPALGLLGDNKEGVLKILAYLDRSLQ
jgi:hypothetical protein